MTKKLEPSKALATAKGAALQDRQDKLRTKLFEALPHFLSTLPDGAKTPLCIVSGVRGAGVSFASNMERPETILMLRELLEHLENLEGRRRGELW